MTDIQKLRELRRMTCDERVHHIERKQARWELVAALPSLLDELEKLRAEIAFRDAPDEPLSKEEIDSIVERVVSGGEL
jgi:hypothetical protein